MDQAVIAAIAGALVGSIGSTFAAVWTGRLSRWQTKAQMAEHHAQWRREARRAAFADVIRASGDVQSACRKATETLVSENLDSTVVEQRLLALGDASASFHSARIIASLEAPQLEDRLAELQERHFVLQGRVRDFRQQRVSFPEVIAAVMLASESTGTFVTAAQGFLNDYAER